MIKDSTIEEIKNRMDIYEVVSDFVRLKKSGSSYKALSPFTNEKTPSFVVSPAKGIFKCFSSGKGGDAISFLMEIDGLSYVESLRYLAQKYAVEIEEEAESEDYKAAQDLRESLFIITNFAKEHFVKNLWETDEGKSIGLSYFKERGFSEETIKRFDLGYALDQWDGLTKAALKNQHSEELLEKAGLRIVNENKAYDRFRGRVIFSIKNVTGKAIAFGARTLKSNEKGPKYINSPETPLYSKSKILYGIFQAKNEIRNQENCYLVEGYTDVVSMSQAGIPNVVASSGTSLTEDQIKLIKRYTDNVTVLFDGDQAGVKASMRGIDMMLAGGLNVKAVPFPDGEDPDSFAKSLGAEPFKEYLVKNAVDFISFKAGIYINTDNSDPISKAETIREIVNSIALIPDAIKRTVYFQECSALLGVEESTLIHEANKILVRQNREKFRPEHRAESVSPPTETLPDEKLGIKDIVVNQERESIRMLVNYGAELIKDFEDQEQLVIDYFLAESEDISFSDPVYTKILNIFKAGLADGKIIDAKNLLSHQDEKIRKIAVDLSSERYEISPHWEKKYKIVVAHERDSLKRATYTNILRLKFRIIQKMIEDNLEKLKSANDESEINRFLENQNNLKKMEMSIAETLGNVTVK